MVRHPPSAVYSCSAGMHSLLVMSRGATSTMFIVVACENEGFLRQFRKANNGSAEV